MELMELGHVRCVTDEWSDSTRAEKLTLTGAGGVSVDLNSLQKTSQRMGRSGALSLDN